MSEQNRCAYCERYLDADPDGYYDREYPYSETCGAVVFCNESCALEKRSKDLLKHGPVKEEAF